MNIGLILPGFSSDARDWCIPVLRHLVMRLAKTNDLRVFALRYPNRADRYEVFGAEVISLGGGTRRNLGSLNVWNRALKLIIQENKKRPFDILHAFWANEAGMITVIGGRILGVPTVVSLGGGELVAFPDINYGGQLTKLERLKVIVSLRWSSAVTGGSKYILNQAKPWMKSKLRQRILQIPLGVDTEFFTPEKCVTSQEPFKLIHVASLTPVKDQGTLLRAIASLHRQNPSILLEIVGDGPLRSDLMKHAQNLGIAEVVKFYGEVEHHELPSFYRGRDLFVLSSRHEAQSMVVLEAAACGIPTVGTSVGILPELAPEAAQVVPVGNSVAMVGALANLVNEKDRIIEMGRQAYLKVSQDWDLSKTVDHFCDLYTVLIREYHGR